MWSLVAIVWLRLEVCLLLALGCWLLGAGWAWWLLDWWLLAAGCWLLVADSWFLAARCWSPE